MLLKNLASWDVVKPNVHQERNFPKKETFAGISDLNFYFSNIITS